VKQTGSNLGEFVDNIYKDSSKYEKHSGKWFKLTDLLKIPKILAGFFFKFGLSWFFYMRFIVKNKFCEVLYLLCKTIRFFNESSVGNFP